jgi:hypothetical protein
VRAKSAIGATLAILALIAGTASVAAAGSAGGSAAGDKAPGNLAALRAATGAFHSIAVSEQHGYALLLDAQGIACIDMPGMGGMGVHWANSALVGDPAIVADRPEALVYAPMRDGTLQLAAVEYVVIKSAWDATHNDPPALFGHGFDVTPEPNRFGLPAFYSLHVWVWEHNPAGTFQMWNPRVVCPGG